MTKTCFRPFLIGVMALAPALGGAEGGGCSPETVPIGQDPVRADSEGSPEDGCSESVRAIRALVAAHQSCEADTDCTAISVRCLPGTSCTGNVHVNHEVARDVLAELERELNSCVNGDPNQSCPVCLRLDPPPVCADKICQAAPEQPAGPCAEKSCGEECSNCVDGQPCLTILQHCDADGVCGGPAQCR